MDRITTETYPDGEELSYTYADDGNLDSIENDSSLQYIYNLNYTLNGKVKNFTSGNGTTTTYGYYDESGGYDQGSGLSNSFRLKSIAVENSSAVELANTVYNYDKLDNVAKKEFTNDYGDHYAEEFEYDFLNRLTSAESYSNNPIEIYGTKTYAYDSRNNITSKDGNTYSYDHSSALSPHAVQSVTGTNGIDEYEYDDNGNVITKLHDSSVVRTILYDGANRVSSISDGGSFSYDASGQRIKKTENGVTTCYFFDAYEEEHDGTDVTTIKYYFANGMRVAKRTQLNAETPVTQYFHTDHLGSAVMMTDESGTRLMSSTYTPYGSDAYIAGAADIKYKFTGQEEDKPTGLYYYGARYYDPELGRFLQADTYLDGLNRYAYCHDNPVKYVDPTGNMGDVAALAAAEADEQIANSDSSSGWTLPEQSTNDHNGDGRVDANERSQDSTGSVGGKDGFEMNTIENNSGDYYFDYKNLILYEDAVYFNGEIIGYGLDAEERKKALTEFYDNLYGNTADVLSNLSIGLILAGGVSSVAAPPAAPIFFGASAVLDISSASLYSLQGDYVNAGLSLTSGLVGVAPSAIKFNSPAKRYISNSSQRFIPNSYAYKTYSKEASVPLGVYITSKILSVLNIEEY